MIFFLFSLTFVGFFLAGWQFWLNRRAHSLLKRVNDELVSRDRKIQTILNNAPIVFSAVDVNGIFHISEGKGLEKLGRKDNQSIGISIFKMHNGNPIILDGVNRALLGEQVATSFVLNGISYDLFMSPEKDESGTVTGVSMLSVDVTDRKQAEIEKAHLEAREQSALATSKMKSEFLATMSHEIRTPINGVLGMTSLLLDTELTPAQREYTEAIKQSGAGLLTVINDILDFSKIEAGKLDFESIHFDLTDLITHATKSLAYVAAQKGVELHTQIDVSPNSWVKGDPGRFRQILNNLVGNAIKFTERGRVDIRVSNIGQTHGVHVEVQDTGIGISEDVQSRLFVAFSQGETSMTRRFGGTGLGLSISKQLVEKMGGQIGMMSQVGKGSKFWFRLPFEAGQSPSQDFAFSAKALPSAFVGDAAAQILVVEDNRVNQIVTVTMLKKMGCNATVATDGIEALNTLENTAYDLVLMDCQMPRMDGLEASRRFRAGDFALNQGVPIIAMTANAMKGDKEKCMAAGMDDYVSKPMTYEQLSTVDSRWLHIRRKRFAS